VSILPSILAPRSPERPRLAEEARALDLAHHQAPAALRGRVEHAGVGRVRDGAAGVVDVGVAAAASALANPVVLLLAGVVAQVFEHAPPSPRRAPRHRLADASSANSPSTEERGICRRQAQ
jgi:hypothetical protein